MKIIRKEISSKDKKRLVMTLTRLEVELLYSITRTSYKHTPKMPQTTQVVHRLKNMRDILKDCLNEIHKDDFGLRSKIDGSPTSCGGTNGI